MAARIFGLFQTDMETVPTQENKCFEGTDVIKVALAKLSHKDREVIVLRYIEQNSIESIARSLQTTRAAIDKRLSRARKRLKQIIDQNDSDLR